MFWAIRPLKNHINQAIAAIQLSNEIKVDVNFHINVTRVEGGGGNILKNLRNLFNNEQRCRLVEHEWLPHPEFKELISQMDIVTQVSFSETFNIIAADAVSEGIPVISSKSITWLEHSSVIVEHDSMSIKNAMLYIVTHQADDRVINKQYESLRYHNYLSMIKWREFLSASIPLHKSCSFYELLRHIWRKFTI